jgi:hypothetical protein
VNVIGAASGAGATNAVVGEWTLNGSIEGPSISADGRLGLGVSNPVQALEVAGNMIAGGTVSSGSPFTFKNAVINGAMAVNQRGISTNWASPTAIGTAASGLNYSIDRMNHLRGAFNTGGGTAQLTLVSTDMPFIDGLRNYLRVGRVSGNGAVDFISCAQALESRESYRFTGQPVTFSVYYRTGSGFSGTGLTMAVAYGTGTDQNGVAAALTNQVTQTITLSSSNAWQRATLTTFIGPASTQLLVYLLYTPSGTAGGFDYFDVTGVQLEKGTVATPFEVRPFGAELALCQRYYYRLTSATGANYMVFGTGSFIGSTTVSQVYIPFPITMRAAATGSNFSNSAPSTFWFGSLGQPATAIAQVGGTEGLNGNQVQFTQAATVTAGVGAIIEANSSYNTFLAFNAEL